MGEPRPKQLPNLMFPGCSQRRFASTPAEECKVTLWQGGPERPKEARGGPETPSKAQRPREAQKGPESPRELQRGPEKPRETQRGLELAMASGNLWGPRGDLK